MNIFIRKIQTSKDGSQVHSMQQDIVHRNGDAQRLCGR